MNSGEPPQKIQVNLQLNCMANSSTENQGQLFGMNSGEPPQKIQVNPSAEL